jgi:hypothetical protein
VTRVSDPLPYSHCCGKSGWWIGPRVAADRSELQALKSAFCLPCGVLTGRTQQSRITSNQVIALPLLRDVSLQQRQTPKPNTLIYCTGVALHSLDPVLHQNTGSCAPSKGNIDVHPEVITGLHELQTHASPAKRHILYSPDPLSPNSYLV